MMLQLAMFHFAGRSDADECDMVLDVRGIEGTNYTTKVESLRSIYLPTTQTDLEKLEFFIAQH